MGVGVGERGGGLRVPARHSPRPEVSLQAFAGGSHVSACASIAAAGNPVPESKGKGAPSLAGPVPGPGPALAPASVPMPTAKVGHLAPGSYQVRTWGWGI